MGALTVKLYDLDTNELADISEIANDPSLKRLLSGFRTFSCGSIAAADPLFTTVSDADGYPNLWKGIRKLVVWEAGIAAPIFHGPVTSVERVGKGDATVPVTITAMSPDATHWGYQADERAGRVVRGSTVQPTAGSPYGNYDGNFIQPKFASSVGGQAGISGPDLMLQVLTNSQNAGAESDPAPGEGPLPIDLSSLTFDLAVPPAIDLSCVDSMSWPAMVGDFFQQLVQTGVCDYDLIPLDPTDALVVANPLLMCAMTARSKIGTDGSATVHFDYDTGIKNAAGIRHLQDFKTICNKLYDYLGPRVDQSHWVGNITPGSPGTTVDPSASRTLHKGQFMWVRVYDSVGSENSSRPLYLALWNAEQGSRIMPRDLLYVTPARDTAADFDALKDYDAGDTIAINAGGSLGLSLADTQRIYGYTKSWSREGVSSVSELLTSADTTNG